MNTKCMLILSLFSLSLLKGMEKSLPGDVTELEKVLGYSFKKPSRLVKALTTKCSNPKKNYEKYELYGDTILHLALTEMLLKLKLPQKSPDSLTQARTALEQNAVLALLGDKLHLEKFIILGNQKMKDAILADVVEALICALYKDGGPQVAQRFIERFWSPMLKNKPLYLLPPKVIIQQWQEATGGAYLLKAKQKKGSREEYLEDITFIRTQLGEEYKQRLPILPQDQDYVIENNFYGNSSPSWAVNVLDYGHRSRLNSIAQKLELTVLQEVEKKEPFFKAELWAPASIARLKGCLGFRISGQGRSRKEAQEGAAQQVLDELSKIKLVDLTTAQFIEKVKTVKGKNARQWLHEWTQLMREPSPDYTISEGAERWFGMKVRFKEIPHDKDGIFAYIVEDTLYDAQECAAGILLREWYKWVRARQKTLPEPRKYVECLAKYHGMKKPVYEDWSAERKLADPVRYYTKVLHGDKVIAVGDASASVQEAQEDAACKAIAALTKPAPRPVRAELKSDLDVHY